MAAKRRIALGGMTNLAVLAPIRSQPRAVERPGVERPVAGQLGMVRGLCRVAAGVEMESERFERFVLRRAGTLFLQRLRDAGVQVGAHVPARCASSMASPATSSASQSGGMLDPLVMHRRAGTFAIRRRMISPGWRRPTRVAPAVQRLEECR